MAQKDQKDLLTRLSDAGEEALSRVAGSQATTRVMETVGGMRERLEDVQKKVRGIDALEKRVEELSKPKRATGSRSRASTTKRATTTRSTTRKRPPSS